MAKSKTQDPTHTTLDGEAELDKYVREHSDKEPEYLYRLYRDTNVRLLHGRMASGHLQGRLLKMLVEMAKPKNVLEVGTFSGYSALCLAEGLSEDGHLYTFEINDEQEDFTRRWIEGSPLSEKISFIIGNAIEEVPRIASEKGMTFDMPLLMEISVHTLRPTRWYFLLCRKADGFLLTIPYGTVMLLILNMRGIIRRKEYANLMMSLQMTIG